MPVGKENPEALIGLLTAHLPHSLPLLRRFQFARTPHGTTPSARIITQPSLEELSQAAEPPRAFAAAYVDTSSGFETQAWLYSSLEAADPSASAWSRRDGVRCLLDLVEGLKSVFRGYSGEKEIPGAILIGSLNTIVLEIMVDAGVEVEMRPSGNHDKWLFREEELPQGYESLPDGMKWADVALKDCKLAVSRTSIPRKAQTLLTLPGLAIKKDDETPICWSFLGQDASLSSLHCEEPYRGQGLATQLAAKLMTSRNRDYGTDGWCSADVSVDNEGSKALCKRLNGRPAWQVRWVLLAVGGESE